MLSYLQLMTRHMEKKIVELLPHRFVVVFYGWSTGSTQYVGVFTTYESNNALGYGNVFLRISSVEDET